MVRFSGVTFAGTGRWAPCPVCDLPIVAGQLIRERDDEFIHAACDGPFDE